MMFPQIGIGVGPVQVRLPFVPLGGLGATQTAERWYAKACDYIGQRGATREAVMPLVLSATQMLDALILYARTSGAPEASREELRGARDALTAAWTTGDGEALCRWLRVTEDFAFGALTVATLPDVVRAQIVKFEELGQSWVGKHVKSGPSTFFTWAAVFTSLIIGTGVVAFFASRD